MFYFEVFNAFYQEKVKYLVVGGLAVNLHGVPRITYDIDIIISTDRDNVLKLNRTLKNLGYVPRLHVNPDNMADEKILKKNMYFFFFFFPTFDIKKKNKKKKKKKSFFFFFFNFLKIIFINKQK